MLYWIGIIITLLAAYLIFRVKVRQDYLNQGALSVYSTALEFAVFGLYINLPYLYFDVPWPTFPPLPDSMILRSIGLSISGLGILVTLAIMGHLGLDNTIGLQPSEVRQSGPYRWTRNPQLLSSGAMFSGMGFLYPSIQTIAWIFLYAVIAHLMVITEEEYLHNQFGEKYKEYCNRVPRYIGRSKGILPE